MYILLNPGTYLYPNQRALEILGAADEDLIEPDAYLSSLLNPVKVCNRNTQEVRALQAVVRGFKPPTDAWVHLTYLQPTLTDVRPRQQYQKIADRYVDATLSLVEFCEKSASFSQAALIDRDYVCVCRLHCP